MSAGLSDTGERGPAGPDDPVGPAGPAGLAGLAGPLEQLVDVRVVVNGALREARVPVRRLLHDLLRHDLGLTGTHAGCEHGVCGACTVLLDGRPVRSCLLLAATATGADVTTVEGLADPDGGPHPVQRAFQECHGLQCGFCTPGFLVTIAAYLDEHAGEPNFSPTAEEAREVIAGNLCRCTGYQNIVASVLRAAELRRTGDPASPPALDHEESGSEQHPDPSHDHDRWGAGVNGERSTGGSGTP